MKINEDKLKEEIYQKIKDSDAQDFYIENRGRFESHLIDKDLLTVQESNQNDENKKNKIKLKPTEKLIFLKFEEFENLINDINDEFSNEKTETTNSKNVFIKAYEIIRDNFGASLQKENKIFLCPYCERNYINVIDVNEDKKIIKPDLDHFYPKSKYPYLACSIENLIPACQFCNQRVKGTLDTFEDVPNPLEVKIFENISFNYLNSAIVIFIENKESLNDKIKNYIKSFYIEEIYSHHTEILDDLLDLSRKYNKVKEKNIYDNCKSFFSREEINDLIFHSYKYIDKKKTPLWKLRKDLFTKIISK